MRPLQRFEPFPLLEVISNFFILFSFSDLIISYSFILFTNSSLFLLFTSFNLLHIHISILLIAIFHSHFISSSVHFLFIRPFTQLHVCNSIQSFPFRWRHQRTVKFSSIWWVICKNGFYCVILCLENKIKKVKGCSLATILHNISYYIIKMTAVNLIYSILDLFWDRNLQIIKKNNYIRFIYSQKNRWEHKFWTFSRKMKIFVGWIFEIFLIALNIILYNWLFV